MYDLHSQLVYWAIIAPEHSSIVEAETGRSITYSHCLRGVQKMRQLLGVQPRNLMLTLSGGIADAVLWLAALTDGHMLIPLAPDAAEEERARAVGMYKPDVLFVEQPEEAQGFPGASNAQIVTRQACELLIEQARTEHISPLPSVQGHVCLMTSGTTGDPKGVILDASQIAWTADHVRKSHRLSPTDRGLTALPFFHVNGPVVGLCASIMAGSTIVIARKTDQQGFIVAYPQGVVGPDGRTGWATGLRGRPWVNDVLFVSDLLNHLQAILCIDPRRIYATGFSNGGGMTNVLACTLAGRLAAFAPVSGSYPPYPGGCHPVRPVPLLEFHATTDPVVPYNGGTSNQLPSIFTWLQGWATRDGCTRGPTVFYTKVNVTGLEWTHCQGNAIVLHFRIRGGGHVWPFVTFNLPGGTAGKSYSASALIWLFFQQHPLPTLFPTG